MKNYQWLNDPIPIKYYLIGFALLAALVLGTEWWVKGVWKERFTSGTDAYESGDYLLALNQLEAARETLLPKYKWEIAVSERELAKVYMQLYQYQEAEHLLESALSTFLDMAKAGDNRDADHAYTLTAIGSLKVSRGQYKEALDSLESARAILEGLPGVQDDQLGDTLVFLGASLQQLGKNDEALKRFDEALKLNKKLLGPRHPQTVRAILALGHLYQEGLGQQGQAQNLYKQALDVVNNQPPNYLLWQALSDMADVLAVQKKFGQALHHSERAHKTIQKLVPPAHPYHAMSMGQLAMIYSKLNRFDEAIPLFEKSLSVLNKIYGPNNPTTKAIRDGYQKLLAKSSAA